MDAVRLNGAVVNLHFLVIAEREGDAVDVVLQSGINRRFSGRDARTLTRILWPQAGEYESTSETLMEDAGPRPVPPSPATDPGEQAEPDPSDSPSPEPDPVVKYGETS